MLSKRDRSYIIKSMEGLCYLQRDFFDYKDGQLLRYCYEGVKRIEDVKTANIVERHELCDLNPEDFLPNAIGQYIEQYPETEEIMEKMLMNARRDKNRKNKFATFMVAFILLYPEHKEIKRLVEVDPEIYEHLVMSFETPRELEWNFVNVFHTGDTVEEMTGIPIINDIFSKSIYLRDLARIKQLQRELGKKATPELLKFFVDNCWYDDATDRSGLYKAINEFYPEKDAFSESYLLFYRANLYQAIDFYELVYLFKEITSLSRQLNVKPNIYTNALKLEKDLLLRQLNERGSI